ncbi:MAG: hypothetical protein M1814_003170 [Vezdaea aestivalis]|nr:MAG: hypothetical protein M1814_003170 [Vezdaea aestivalis]
MTDPQTTGTPGSGADSVSGGRNYVVKDKICQFCNAAFTSSSLGRHLDLYIRDKNPKAPDGVHEPDQIRLIRGNITRRKNRKSSGQRETSTPSQTEPPQPPPSEAVPVTAGWHATNGVSGQRTSNLRLNEPSWEVTGVINGLRGSASSEPRRDISSRSYAKTTIGNRLRLAETSVEQRAAELALREVLDSIKAATSRVSAQSPFDFNPFECTFPALCLELLPSPPLLFSTDPFPSSASWSIEPPGPQQFELLKSTVRDKFLRHRNDLPSIMSIIEEESRSSDAMNVDKSPHSTQSPPPPSHVHSQMEDREKELTKQEITVLAHVDATFSHWDLLSESEKASKWTLEALRAFTKSTNKEQTTAEKLSLANQTSSSLQQQVDRLSACQAPREHLIIPPATHPVPSKLAQELTQSYSASLMQWEYEPLVAKWRATVAKQREVHSLAQQRPLPTHEPWPTPNGLLPRNTGSLTSADADDASEVSAADTGPSHTANDPMDTDHAPHKAQLPAVQGKALAPRSGVMGEPEEAEKAPEEGQARDGQGRSGWHR